ncbi:Protein mpe1 [Tilletia horrida]|nr:Protein mpe1 [Tilletia horrida]
MASASVYYKFRSQKDFSRITFDGTGISVWDLKREIILQNKMGRGQDFDLKLFNADTRQEYTDDNAIVPRSSQVTAQRAPPSRPNEGTAQKYVAAHFAGLAGAAGLGDNGPGSRFSHNANASGVANNAAASSSAATHDKRGAMSRRFDGKSAPPAPAPALPDASSIEAPTGDEATSIAAMFAASNAEWDQAQQGMSTATYIGRGGITRRGGRGFHGGGRGGGPSSERRPHVSHGAHKPPGPGYICYRCGQKGHWIQDCPTNDDREFDNRPRLKRTTGIPKSMLKTIEQPPEGALLSGGVMITPDGSYVIAQADTASWQKNQALAKPLSENDVYAQLPSDSSLACPLCAKLLRNAVKTPCCGTLYCEECIQTHLLEHDFQCAECEKRIPDLADLKRDEDTIKKVRQYVQDVMARHERGEAGAATETGTAADGTGEADKAGDETAGKTKQEAGSSEDKTEPAALIAAASGDAAAESMKREASAAGSESKATGTPSRSGSGRPGPLAGKHGLPPKPNIQHSSPPPSSSSGGNPTLSPSHHTNHGNTGAGGAAGLVNPALMLPQMMMMLQNPNLPPQVRMQLQMNAQMIQSQLMNGVQGAGPHGGGGGGGGNGMRMGMPMGMSMGMGGMGGMQMGMGMHQQQQQQAGRPLNNGYNFQGAGPQHDGASNWINGQHGMMGGGMGANSRKRDRGEADLVEVAGGGGGGGNNDAVGGGGAMDQHQPANKMARMT